MGTRVILYALTRLGLEGLPEGAAKLGRLVLAAPDFDLGEFHQVQAKLSKTVGRFIYSLSFPRCFLALLAPIVLLFPIGVTGVDFGCEMIV
jgi:esterase/lipase superfamily enzyme